MKVSLKWLKELVDINVSYEELERKFSLMSSEVDNLTKLVEATNLTVGHVLECVPHPDSDHLHVTKVDVKDEVLQIVCGAPNVDAGQKVIVALVGAELPGDFKIKKSKIRGVESFGMLCSLEELGIPNKFHNENGIHILGDDAKVGTNPVEYLELDTTVLELDLTPNRGDLLSMMGVAYDTKALLNTEVHFVEPKFEELEEENDINVKIDTPLCKAYYARVLKDVVIKKSPRFMESALIASGIRPINNVVDITNYVMLYTGQPLHAFDYDTFETKDVVVREANKGEKFVTLDNVERTLEEHDILITDGVNATCLGGVMGGLVTEITDNTVNVMLESANFNNVQIRKTSKRLDLRSEASMRFERGIDSSRTKYALELATYLLVKYADAKVCKGISYVSNSDDSDRLVKVTKSQVVKVVGYDYTLEDIKEVFDRLSFKYDLNDEEFTVYVPARRRDISTYQDLIEEVVRIKGFDIIPTNLPVSDTCGQLTPYQVFQKKVRNNMAYSLDEAITYSLVSSEQAVAFDETESKVVEILMPLTDERRALRHSLIPSLLSVVKYNLSRKNDDVSVFEIGNRYFEGDERLTLSGALTGLFDNTLWQGKKEVVDFFLTKGILENLFNKLGIDNVTYAAKKDLVNMHPGVTAGIYANGEYLGFVGKIHPSYGKKVGLKEVYVFELDLLKMFEVHKDNSRMLEIPKYPSVSRDLAFVQSKDVTSDMITNVIKKVCKKTLVDLRIFDVYVGENVEAGTYSIAYNLTFQDNTKTLSTEEVDALVKRVLKRLNEELNVTLRS